MEAVSGGTIKDQVATLEEDVSPRYIGAVWTKYRKREKTWKCRLASGKTLLDACQRSAWYMLQAKLERA